MSVDQPICGAYIAIAPASEKLASEPIRTEKVMVGRTNDVGWAVERTMDTLGDPDDVPKAAVRRLPPPSVWFLLAGNHPVKFERSQKAQPELIHGLPNEAYRVFWTYDQSQFIAFHSEVQVDAQAAFDAWEANTISIAPFGQPASLKGLDLLTPAEAEAVSRLLIVGNRQGYHGGWYFEDAATTAIFDVTPSTLRALYLCEWLEWYTAHLREDKNWSTLLTAQNVTAVSEQCGHVEAFDAEAREYMTQRMRAAVGAEVNREWGGYWEYRRYANECAKACAGLNYDERRDVRDLFIQSLEVYERAGRWLDAARQLRDDQGVLHPHFRGEYTTDPDLTLKDEAAREPFVSYFDFYLAGLRFKHDGLTDNVRQAQQQVDETFRWIEGHRRKLLKRDIPFERFTWQLSRVVRPDELSLLQEWYGRYTRQCATLGYAWWVDADQRYLNHRPEWQTLAQNGGWIGNSGLSASELLKTFVESHAFSTILDDKSARAAIRFMLRFERWAMRGELEMPNLVPGRATYVFERARHGISLSVDIGDGTPGTSSSVRIATGEYYALSRATASGLHPSAAAQNVKVKQVNLEQLEKTLGRKVVQVPADLSKMGEVSQRLGEFANLLNAAVAVYKLAQSEEKVDFFASRATQTTTWSVLQAVETVGQFAEKSLAARNAVPAMREVLAWSRYAGKLGLVAEGAYNLYDGYKLLYAEDSDAIKALDQGDVTGGLLEMIKGAAQATAGAGAVGSVLVGVSSGVLSVAAAPFALVLGLGTLAVIVLEASIYVRKSSRESRVQDLIERVNQAKQAEFQLDARGRQTSPGLSTSRLSQRVASLNHIAKQAI